MRAHIAGVLHTIIFNRALGAFRPKEVDSELFDITYVSLAERLCMLLLAVLFHCSSISSECKQSLGGSITSSSWLDAQAQCGDSYVEKAVEDKIDQFYAWVEKHPRKKGQVCVGSIFCPISWPINHSWQSDCWQWIRMRVRVRINCRKPISSPVLQVVLAFFEKRKTQRWSLIGGKQEERLYWEQWSVVSQFASAPCFISMHVEIASACSPMLCYAKYAGAALKEH